jgi:hypothetical protein
MKLAVLAAAIALAACSSTPAEEAAGDKPNEQLFAVNGEPCPPGSIRPQMPVSYSSVTDSGCRTKSDWQRMKEIRRAYERCVNDAKTPQQEAGCRYRMQ